MIQLLGTYHIVTSNLRSFGSLINSYYSLEQEISNVDIDSTVANASMEMR